MGTVLNNPFKVGLRNFLKYRAYRIKRRLMLGTAKSFKDLYEGRGFTLWRF
jgi:hypothetical protein